MMKAIYIPAGRKQRRIPEPGARYIPARCVLLKAPHPPKLMPADKQALKTTHFRFGPQLPPNTDLLIKYIPFYPTYRE